VDAHYTVAPFLKPVHELGIPILGRVRNNRCFYLPAPEYGGFGRPAVLGRKIRLNDARTQHRLRTAMTAACGTWRDASATRGSR
jgi:DDE superfamily endonuclease